MLSYTQLESNHTIYTRGSLNRRIFRIVALAFLALILYFLVSDYYTTIHHVEKLTLDRLQGIVRDLAGHIDGDQHLELTTRLTKMDELTHSEDDPAYLTIHHLLAQAHQAHQLGSPIYTFVKPDNSATNHLEFIATSSAQPYYRHRYTSMPTHGYANLDNGGVMELYQDEFGHWLSAFAPIKNKEGKTVAYVQADEKFDLFIYQVGMQTARSAFFSLLGFSLVLFLLLRYLRHTLRKEAQQKALLTESLEKTQRLSKKLEAREQQLRENTAKLEHSNKDLTDFAHIASHDLKAPLRTIHSFAQLLQRRLGKDIDSNTREYLDFILSNSKRAQKLINGLLQYSTADKNMGEQLAFPIHGAVKEAIDSLITTIEERNAKVIYSDMPIVKANPTLISQVLQNLINNGIKYNQSENPTVEIGTSLDPEKGRYFFVKDNGIGIPSEYQEDIFKMFTRLHSSEHYEGSGIGLAFCSRVIQAYGGTIWLESANRRGSTFFFTLPLAEETPAVARKGAASSL